MKTTFIILCCFCLCACAARSTDFATPKGEKFTLRHIDNSRYGGELLALADSTLFFESNNRLHAIPISKIKKIHIHGYSVKGVKTPTMLAVIGIDIAVISIAGGDDDVRTLTLLSGLSLPLAMAGIFIGDPKVNFTPPFTASDLYKLRLYCRYPQGLASEQWQALLNSYGQKEFHRLLE
ncbi:MAG: hypothetical protein ONB46_20030 [candidate division KSB1 bacterium]|nr:hypothetical protein [candidate division KSB1 bacterium]MDZ7369251.1 hypothetical protein [candidate division KSB1 bacterium]